MSLSIAMILDKPFPIDPRVENEALKLIEAGYDVHLLCFKSPEHSLSKEVYKGIKVSRIELPNILYKLSALAYTLPLYHRFLKKRITKFIEEIRADVIHIHDLPPARSVFWANRSLQKTIVLDLHENRPEIMKEYAHVQRFPGRILINPSTWKKFERRYMQKADHTVVVTKEAKEYYLLTNKIEDHKIVVVPNSVSQNFSRKSKVDDSIGSRYSNDYVLIYIGDTGWRRGIQTVIRAIPIIKKQISNIKLIILGTSKDRYRLEELAKKQGVTDNVEFLGWINQDEFPSYIRVAKVGLCPILRNVHHDTTYANKLFQYLSLGVPILVSDCTAQRNLTIDYHVGKVHEADNHKDFAETLLEIAAEADNYDQYSKNAISSMQSELSWEHLSVDLIKLYRSIETKATNPPPN